jgi:hypothetical protein
MQDCKSEFQVCIKSSCSQQRGHISLALLQAAKKAVSVSPVRAGINRGAVNRGAECRRPSGDRAQQDTSHVVPRQTIIGIQVASGI